MLSQLSLLFTGFLTRRFEGVINAALMAVMQEILKKGRQTLFLIMMSFVLSVLFSAGVIISLLEASAQYDARGAIYFTALLSSSLIMAAVSAIILAVIFWPRRLHTSTVHDVPHVGHVRTPLEEILSTAVTHGMEYFKNRQETKARPTNYSKNYAQA